MANSLWLDKDVEYVQEKMDSIAYDYYASCIRRSRSEKTNKADDKLDAESDRRTSKDRTLKCQLEPKDQVTPLLPPQYTSNPNGQINSMLPITRMGCSMLSPAMKKLPS